MALNFPNNPTVNQIFTNDSDSWIWNGITWEVRPVSSPAFINVTASGTISATTGFIGPLTGNVIGNVIGNVTGTVSSISNHNLNDLLDVNTGTPADNAVLAYDADTNTWNSLVLESSFTGGTVPNPINVTANTVSSSTTTGALRVAGGIGIVGSSYFGGIVNATTHVQIQSGSEIRLNDSDNTNYVGFKSPTTVTTNYIWTLPSSDGTSGQVLQTNGSGVLSWGAGTGGGSATAAGLTTHVQYNDSGLFAGDATFTFDDVTGLLSVPKITTTSTVTISDTAASTSTSTGALQVSGGVGIAGQLNVGGAINKVTATTASTSTTTGALIIAGGIGIAGSANVGGNITAPTAPTESTHVTNKAYVDSNVLAFSMAFGV